MFEIPTLTSPRSVSPFDASESVQMSFTGGKLKLKGGSGDLPGVKKKKKSKETPIRSSEMALAVAELPSDKDSVSDDLKKVLHGYSLPAPDEADDRRTAAEKKHDEHMKKLEAARLQKLAAKSHRHVPVMQFNTASACKPPYLPRCQSFENVMYEGRESKSLMLTSQVSLSTTTSPRCAKSIHADTMCPCPLGPYQYILVFFSTCSFNLPICTGWTWVITCG